MRSMPVHIKAKKTSREILRKRQKEDRAWMRQQRTLWEEVFLFDVITVKMPATIMNRMASQVECRGESLYR